MMPKRSYDFDKFSLDTMPETERTALTSLGSEELQKKIPSFKYAGPTINSLNDSNQFKQTETNFQIDKLPIEESIVDSDLNSGTLSLTKIQNNDQIKNTGSNSEFSSKPSSIIHNEIWNH